MAHKDVIREEFDKFGIKNSPQLENKAVELMNQLELRTGVVLVGETFTGKSKTLKVVKNVINNKNVLEFNKIYNNFNDEKNVREDERKSLLKNDNSNLFRQILNTLYQKVSRDGVVDLNTINPKI